VYVDVSLNSGAPVPATVRLQALQAATVLSQKDYDWPAGGSQLKAGIELPKGASGKLAIKATGFDKGGTVVVMGMSSEGDIGGTTFAVALGGPVPEVGDAGSEVLPTPTDGGTPADLGVADATPTVETQAPDATTPRDAGTVDSSGADAPVDAPAADAPGDAPVTLDGLGPDVARLDTTVSIDTAPTGGAWSAPVKMQDEQGNYVLPPTVAMSPVSGNAVVAWADDISGVKAVRYTAATDTWSAATTVSPDGNVFHATVAADAKGHFAMVWSKAGDGVDATSPGLWASFSTDGATWSKPVQLWAGGAKNYDPSIWISMNRDGQAMVLWDHFESPANTSLQHQLYAVYLEGTSNQVPTLVATKSYEFDARVAIDGNGSGIIAWVAPDTTVQNDSIWAATFAKQTLGTPALLESYDTDETQDPALAMNAAGQGIVTWHQRVSSNLEGYSRRYSATTSWASSELILRSSWAGQMSAALDSYGTASVVSSRPVGPGYQATFSSQTIGGAWTTENLESDDRAPAFTHTDVEPVLALSANGNALVGWRKKISDNEFVPHLRWRIGSTWGPEAEVGKVLDMFSSHMQIAVSDNGQAIAAWTYYHCDPGSDYADRICPTAKKYADLSAASSNAWGMIYAAVYR
jgi:hypothetical protein